MLKRHNGGIPPKIEMYIRIQITRMLRTNLFQNQEREDLQQELALFFIEHFYKKDVDIPDELLFIALRRQANHLIRSRIRGIQSGVFFNESLNSMSEENGIEIRSDFCLEDLENKIDINTKLESLSQKEKSIINLLLKGCSIEKITKTLHVSNSTVYKVLSKIKDL